MRIVSVVGARPQFVKAAVVSRALRDAGHDDLLVHTGQHFDHEMSQLFFDELEIPRPDINLEVGSGPHGRQTGLMLERIEAYLRGEDPDAVLVYGDTNSTLAGALAAVKMHIPVAHVEAGLRSYNRAMPEEHNRVLTDHASTYLFCPTRTWVENLEAEGLTDGVHLVGDPMYDAVLRFQGRSRADSTILEDLALEEGAYRVLTLHRPYNTDRAEVLRTLLTQLEESRGRTVFPVHPRTSRRIEALGGTWTSRLERAGVTLIPPVGYLDMLRLVESARLVMTDSGGLQKEAYFLGVPCITLRPETEWVETLEGGWNRLLGPDRGRLTDLLRRPIKPAGPRAAFGAGDAGHRIAEILAR